MKRILLSIVVCILSVAVQAQDTFKRTLYDNAHNIYLVINFYDHNVIMAGQDFMGEMDGYLGDYEDYRKWLILDVVVDSPDVAHIEMINLEGSEDLRATLTHNDDGTYTLRQGSGSTLKIARQGKWVKLPKNITFSTTREKR